MQTHCHESRRPRQPPVTQGALWALVVSLVCLAAGAPPAAGQQPTAPDNGAQIPDVEVVLRWQLPDGWHTRCIEWSARPETSYPEGPFLRREGGTCLLDGRDLAYILELDRLGTYYWHVQAGRYHCPTASPYDCRDEEAWGPIASFESVEPPPPPAPTQCNARAAAHFAANDLLPYAAEKYPSYYEDIAEGVDWGRAPLICRDLTGDRDREMIIRLQCCTGGSLSPWAIYRHDSAGQWRREYAQVKDTVFRLTVRRRVVRAMVPSPYEGACTSRVRYRSVKWNGARFKSSLSGRKRLRNPC
jgi:hypothetical protein